MSNLGDSTRDVHGRQPEAHVVRLLDEFLNRQAAGDPQSEEALLASHPEYADELREHLELVRHLRPRKQRIEELLARGVLRPTADRAIPAMLAGYHVHGVLGEGGMGVVLDGHDAQLNRHVALKILRPESANDSLALARFEREAKAAGALQHPNVLTIYGVGCDRGVHYIVMERMAGPSLGQVLSTRGPLAQASAQAVFGQILEGLSAAHGAGLIHRDIKASNILLDRWPGDYGVGVDERESQPAPSSEDDPAETSSLGGQYPVVKIADFGLARMRSSQTQLTLGDSILGTPEYMSPEQARGDAGIDHRTDLYSAGVVLYEMLTGRTPFKAETPTATIRRILDEEPEDPRRLDRGIDQNLATLALRLMEKDPGDRFASAMDALTALRSGEPVNSVRRRFRSRAFRAAVGAGLLCVAAWVVFHFAAGRPLIAAVRIDESTERAVQVRCGQDTEWRVVHQFPSEAPPIRDVSGIDPDGRGRDVAVVGLEQRWEGSNIFAFDANGGSLWASHLSDDSGRIWPDCASSPDWICLALARGDLDGQRGDELVVVASAELEYPTRVSIIDPRSGRVRPDNAFWHLGNLNSIRVVEDFFEDGRPAIVAWGLNNKLDGFDYPPHDRPRRPAHWDRVPVMVVLDPVDMNGLGPPRNSRAELRDIPRARPYAYAFLDLAPDRDVGRAGVTGDERQPERRVPKRSSPDEIGDIGDINVLPRRTADDTAPRFVVKIVGLPKVSEAFSGQAYLRLARDLTLLEVVPIQGKGPYKGKEYWEQHWHPIIQDGEYVDG